MLSWCCQYECSYHDGAYYCKSCGARRIMAKIWEPQPIEVYKSWMDAIIEEAQDDLSSWESDFCDSISNRLADGRNLTQGQADKLEQIYVRYTE